MKFEFFGCISTVLDSLDRFDNYYVHQNIRKTTKMNKILGVIMREARNLSGAWW